MKRPHSVSTTAELRATLDRLKAEATDERLSSHARKKLDSELRNVIDELGDIVVGLDPIRQPVSVFDPSNPKIVGRFVSLALVAQERHPLTTVPRTYGSGVYAIYYRGSFPHYAALRNTETPLYVGQAAPLANNARSPREQGARLCARLTEHRKNIAKATSTLELADFDFRSLVIQSGWETAAEDYLIHLFRPIWNSETGILYGLGKHGDDALTRANKRSPWDTLHPGRAWAAKSSEDAKGEARILSELNTHFERYPAFQNLEELLSNFLEELRQV